LISLVTFSSNFFSFILWYSNILKVNYKEKEQKNKAEDGKRQEQQASSQGSKRRKKKKKHTN
jgi:hypothetical protein